MKILLVTLSTENRSALQELLQYMEETFHHAGIETYVTALEEVRGCVSCGKCYKASRCVIDDEVNELTQRAAEFDGLVAVTPVFYGMADQRIQDFLERLFRVSPQSWLLKPAGCVLLCRSGNGQKAYETLIRLFEQADMPVMTSHSTYSVHGSIKDDEPGRQSAENLMRQMIYLLKCIDAGRTAGIEKPDIQTGKTLGYIR